MASWSPAHYVAQTSNVSAFAYRQTCEPMGGSSPLRIGRLYGIHDAWASIGSRVESPRGRKELVKDLPFALAFTRLGTRVACVPFGSIKRLNRSHDFWFIVSMTKTTKKLKGAASPATVPAKIQAVNHAEPVKTVSAPKAPEPVKTAPAAKLTEPVKAIPAAKPPEPVKTLPVAKAPEPKAPEPAKINLSKASRVSLELIKPGAKQVYVAGTFNEWKPERTPLVTRGDGRWVGDLAIKPGRYEYLFVVDGQWVPDPNAKESVQNPFGGLNSVLVAAAA